MSVSAATPATEAAWHEAAAIRPRLRDHVDIHRHLYRGRRWYVMQDHASGKFTRFSPQAYYLIALMDGRRTLATLWEEAREQFGKEAPSRAQLLGLLAQLHAAEALLTERVPDPGELERRSGLLRRQRRIGALRTPLAVRIPLLDPERWLERMTGFARWLYSPLGLALWLLVVVSAGLQLGVHWAPLTENLTDRVLSTENLVLLFFVFPFVKALHEIGHGLAVKRWGGEVHEMGIMLLVFVPMPYVDASASSAFRGRGQRVLVGAAGIIVEIFIAALALHVWINAEPGAVRAVAFNVMFISGVSTVLFNGNPLLRFDGYYILMDLLEIPNLGTRANRQLAYLARRYLLRQEGARSQANDGREAFWLVGYGISAYIYRLFILTVIVLFVASEYFIAGVLIALWVLVNAVALPLYRQISTLLFDPALIGRRGAAMARVALVLGGILIFLFAVPFPESTIAQGVVRPPDDAVVYAESSGTVREVVAASGDDVTADDLLLRFSDPVLAAEVEAARAELREAQARLLAARASDRVSAAAADERLALARSRLADAQERMAGLELRAPSGGRFMLPELPDDLPGRFVGRGEPVGWILPAPPRRIRVVVDMDTIDQVRTDTESVEVLVTSRRADPRPAALVREIPAATSILPAAALSVEGGGPFALDPEADRPGTTLQPLFQFDVDLATALPYERLGQRVYVKFRHPWSPLAVRAYRAIRRVFLSRFDV